MNYKNGLEILKEEDPVTAKTRSIITMAKLESIPQRFFNFSIVVFNRSQI